MRLVLWISLIIYRDSFHFLSPSLGSNSLVKVSGWQSICLCSEWWQRERGNVWHLMAYGFLFRMPKWEGNKKSGSDTKTLSTISTISKIVLPSTATTPSLKLSVHITYWFMTYTASFLLKYGPSLVYSSSTSWNLSPMSNSTFSLAICPACVYFLVQLETHDWSISILHWTL